ncbi:MAG: hypothetical protein Q9226_001736 [Calogaya cf. arnoldii]
MQTTQEGSDESLTTILPVFEKLYNSGRAVKMDTIQEPRPLREAESSLVNYLKSTSMKIKAMWAKDVCQPHVNHNCIHRNYSLKTETISLGRIQRLPRRTRRRSSGSLNESSKKPDELPSGVQNVDTAETRPTRSSGSLNGSAKKPDELPPGMQNTQQMSDQNDGLQEVSEDEGDDKSIKV